MVQTEVKDNRIDTEIKEKESHIVSLKLLPKKVGELLSFIWFGWRIELHPLGETPEVEQQNARKIRGLLESAGVPVVVGKEEGYGENDDKMYLDFTIAKQAYRITDYMAKTCRLVVKTVELPAVEAKVIEAKPARTVTRTIIECDGLQSKVIKTEEKITESKDSTESQVEKDLDQAELESPGSTQ